MGKGGMERGGEGMGGEGVERGGEGEGREEGRSVKVTISIHI